MKFLRNIPGLLKRHYEKLILALALIALIGAVVVLSQKKSAENETIENYNRGIIKRKSKPIQTMDPSALTTALTLATNPPAVTLAPPHNLLNPVKWQRRPDGSLLKVETGREIGPNAVELLKITPLRLIITLDGQSGSGVNMSVMPETNRFVRSKLQSFVTTNSPSERIHRTRFFTLRDLKVTPDGPVVEIELADGTKETVTPARPFSRVDGYRADLNYPPEKKTFNDRRAGDVLTLNSEDYIIVAITTNEVVFSARSNDRRTIIRNNAALIAP